MQKLSPIEINEICEELGETYPKSIEQVHGGDIHNSWRIEFSNKKLFLKRNCLYQHETRVYCPLFYCVIAFLVSKVIK